MSGNGSSSRSSGTITGTGNGNDRYRDITTSPFGTTHFRTAYRTDAVTNGPTSMLPEPGAQTAYTEALLNRDSMPGPSRRPGLLSPFAPAYYPPTSTVAPAELTAGVRPMASPPRASENAATNCGCLTCSDSTPARCSQSQLTQQYELMTRTWEEQRTFFEDFRVRLDIIYREEARITIGHYRTLWEAEKAQLNREIAYLNHQVQMLGDQNLRLRGQLADQVQYAEPIIHQGSFQGQGNTPMVDGSPPSPMASRHNGGARMYDSVRDSHWSPGMPSNFSNAFGLGSLESPRVPNFANRSPTASLSFLRLHHLLVFH
ncbi:hypothetical protein TrVFT333_001754 [Trichoderma virens FT-333]|nr:hypothetical protein TrVFT333_001754 [Trichoderma virens FT-333]